MKITINTPCLEDKEKVERYVREFCKNNFKEYKIEVEEC